MNIILILVALIIFVVWAEKLKELARSRSDKKKEFYLLFFIFPIISIIYYLVTSQFILISIYNPLQLSIMVTVLFAFLYLWAYFARDAAGEERYVWFYLILLFAPFWVLYWVTGLK
ncbi:MAG: hypothetical protein [Siphoviridae sp. ctjeG17]|nr:MAG: hypothetical protein [Siphoviridae sp. ctjeG17]